MNTRNLGLLAIAVLAMVALGACSPGYGSPTSAAESYFNAFEAQNEEDLRNSVCEAMQDQIVLIDTDDSDETKVELDIELRFVEVDDSDDNENTATVNAFGSIRFRAIDEGSDNVISSSSRGDTPVFQGIIMTKEDGDWKVCDPSVLNAGLAAILGS